MKYKSLSDKWLAFASDDLRVVEAAARENIYHLACFHAQQSAEKSLKGFIIFTKGRTEKTHSLIELLNEAVRINKEVEKFREHCLILDRYYIPTRYPDALPGSLPEGLPGKNNAEQALKYAEEIFEFAKRVLL